MIKLNPENLNPENYACTLAGVACLAYVWREDANERFKIENDDAMRMLYIGRSQAASAFLKLVIGQANCTFTMLQNVFPQLVSGVGVNHL